MSSGETAKNPKWLPNADVETLMARDEGTSADNDDGKNNENKDESQQTNIMSSGESKKNPKWLPNVDVETLMARDEGTSADNDGSKNENPYRKGPDTATSNADYESVRMSAPGAYDGDTRRPRQDEDEASPLSPSPPVRTVPSGDDYIRTNVVAALVQEESSRKLVTAESVEVEGCFHNKPRAKFVMALLLILVVGLAVGLGAALSGRGGGDDDSGEEALDEPGLVSAMEPIDGEVGSEFGSSVSLCSSGSRFAVAAPGSGLVRVFELDGEGNSFQVGQDLTYNTFPFYFGMSKHVRTPITVDLSGDCAVLAVGLPYYEYDLRGRVELYKLDSQTQKWEPLGSPNAILGEAGDDFAGSSVSLSRDGGLVAISSPGHDLNGEFSGQVRLFQINNENWEQLGDSLHGTVQDEAFGGSVWLSTTENSNIVAVGSTTGSAMNTAAAKVYLFRTGRWELRGSEIQPDAESLVGKETSWMVRLSRDGTMLVISNVYQDGESVSVVTNNEALYVAAYKFGTDDWVQLSGNLHANVEGSKSGYVVSVSEDGTRIGMGDPGSGQAGGLSGHAHIYEYSEGRWCQLGENIDENSAGDMAGFSISLSGDGSRILVGSPFSRAQGRERGRVLMKDVTENIKRAKSCE